MIEQQRSRRPHRTKSDANAVLPSASATSATTRRRHPPKRGERLPLRGRVLAVAKLRPWDACQRDADRTGPLDLVSLRP